MATFTGTNDADTLLGTADDDRLVGSEGSDTLNGGLGIDIADYSHLGQTITLTPGGGVIKGGGGQDLLIGIEKIIGDANQSHNTIDASTASAGAGMDVDLATNTITVNIPSVGTRIFTVENFNDVVGTNSNSRLAGNSNDNKITGGSGNDVIVGSAGNDTLKGGGGYDTIDYSNLGQAVTILPKGSISKGSLGTDTVNNVSKIIGATGQANTIDASTAGIGASLDVNLGNKSMNVNIPGFASQHFDVHNFVNVIGSKYNDTIVGDNLNSTLTGSGGNDTIRGGNKNDIIAGTDGKARGYCEVDTLTGGGGRDKFVLGNSSGAYYVGNGKNDYAKITDFDLATDSIDLGSLKNYSFGFEGKNTINLFSGRNSWSRDLVAKIQLTDACLATYTRCNYGSSYSNKESHFESTSFSGLSSRNIDRITSSINIQNC